MYSGPGVLRWPSDLGSSKHFRGRQTKSYDALFCLQVISFPRFVQ